MIGIIWISYGPPPPPLLFILFCVFFWCQICTTHLKKNMVTNLTKSLHQTYPKKPVAFPNVFFVSLVFRHVSNKLTWSCHGAVKPRRAAFQGRSKGQDVTVMHSEELEGFLRKKIFCSPKKSSDFSYTWMFPKMVVPQNTPKWSFLVGKPMVVGYPHFRKQPF